MRTTFIERAMTYRFATEDQDYSDLSAGRVLMGLPGLPAFPVRLASEMFQRSLHHLLPYPGPVTIYDPTCGGAYHLAALGFLHGAQIASILASDIEPRAVALAERNLSLLHPAGLATREAEIGHLYSIYGKTSHSVALESVHVLRRMRMAQENHIQVDAGTANALEPDSIGAFLAQTQIDIILSDLPYGSMSTWQVEQESPNPPAWRLLDALLPNIRAGAVIALAADKTQKISHEGYRRLERFQIGKRQVTLLTVQ